MGSMGLWSTGGWGYGVLENGFRILEDWWMVSWRIGLKLICRRCNFGSSSIQG